MNKNTAVVIAIYRMADTHKRAYHMFEVTPCFMLRSAFKEDAKMRREHNIEEMVDIAYFTYEDAPEFNDYMDFLRKNDISAF